jgi:hypothetical protein
MGDPAIECLPFIPLHMEHSLSPPCKENSRVIDFPTLMSMTVGVATAHSLSGVCGPLNCSNAKGINIILL